MDGEFSDSLTDLECIYLEMVSKQGDIKKKPEFTLGDKTFNMKTNTMRFNSAPGKSYILQRSRKNTRARNSGTSQKKDNSGM